MYKENINEFYNKHITLPYMILFILILWGAAQYFKINYNGLILTLGVIGILFRFFFKINGCNFLKNINKGDSKIIIGLTSNALFLSYSAIWLLIFAFVRIFIFEHMKVPSESMLPNIKVGDIIYVSKPNYFDKQTTYEKGDVIVFKFPLNKDINFVKRVVGTPKDTIEIVDDNIYINGKEIQREFVKKDKHTIIQNQNNNVSGFTNIANINTELNGNKKYIVAINNPEQEQSHQEKNNFPNNEVFISKDACHTTGNNKLRCEIPKDKYFVMGDNRNFSADSRVWGLVDKKDIIGLVKKKFPYTDIDESISIIKE